jgi:hypothetical protein
LPTSPDFILTWSPSFNRIISTYPALRPAELRVT